MDRSEREKRAEKFSKEKMVSPSPSTSTSSAYALSRFGLSGKRALVTGGTKGIGKAIVEELALLGCSVVTCSRNARELQEAQEHWRARGLDVVGVAADVSTPEGRNLVLELCRARDVLEDETREPLLDILVNNVGTNVKKPSTDYNKDDYDLVMGTNLESAVALTALAHPLLKRGAEEANRKREEASAAASAAAAANYNAAERKNQAPETSSVVLISSVAGGPPSMRSGSLYAATKAALDQLARNWACEWASDGIRVTAVKPFYIDTPLASGVVGDPEQLAKVLDATPSRRVGLPEDVAGVVAFLCSRAAAHVTGETVSVEERGGGGEGGAGGACVFVLSKKKRFFCSSLFFFISFLFVYFFATLEFLYQLLRKRATLFFVCFQPREEFEKKKKKKTYFLSEPRRRSKS